MLVSSELAYQNPLFILIWGTRRCWGAILTDFCLSSGSATTNQIWSWQQIHESQLPLVADITDDWNAWKTPAKVVASTECRIEWTRSQLKEKTIWLILFRLVETTNYIVLLVKTNQSFFHRRIFHQQFQVGLFLYGWMKGFHTANIFSHRPKFQESFKWEEFSFNFWQFVRNKLGQEKCYFHYIMGCAVQSFFWTTFGSSPCSGLWGDEWWHVQILSQNWSKDCTASNAKIFFPQQKCLLLSSVPF